jgi:hypothetical protein
MKKLIQATTLSLLSLLALCNTNLKASSNCGWAAPGWALGGELLYFKAVTDNTGFVYSLPVLGTITGTEGRKLSNDPGFKPGFRLEGDACFGNCINQFQVRYAHLFNKHTRTANGIIANALFFPGGADVFLGATGTSTSRVSLTYNAGDLVWQRYLFNAPDFDLNFIAGLHIAGISYKEGVDFTTAVSNPTFTWKSCFWGVGPEVGVAFQYLIAGMGNFAIAGDARGALLAGRTTARFQASQPGSTAVSAAFDYSSSPGNWGARPAFDGRLGFNYSTPCFSLEIGYEMIWYSRPIEKFVFSAPGGSATIDQYSNLGMHGPYAALGFTF